MVVDLSVFRHERQMLRSQRRLESLRVEEAYDRFVSLDIGIVTSGLCKDKFPDGIHHLFRSIFH